MTDQASRKQDPHSTRDRAGSGRDTGQLIGFVDLGDINNHLSNFKHSMSNESEADDHTYTPSLAKSMLVFMVRGLFTKLKFPYAQFPCVALAGEQMFLPFWQAVARLERIGFKVCII